MPGDDSWETAPFFYHVSPRENHWCSCDRKERDESVHQEPLPLSPVSYIHGAKASLSGIPLHLLAASPPPAWTWKRGAQLVNVVDPGQPQNSGGGAMVSGWGTTDSGTEEAESIFPDQRMQTCIP